MTQKNFQLYSPIEAKEQIFNFQISRVVRNNQKRETLTKEKFHTYIFRPFPSFSRQPNRT